MSGTHVLGIGVWPHGRRPVRIEDNDDGWTVVVGGEGSMLIGAGATPSFLGTVFGGMPLWEIEEWVARRGFTGEVAQNEGGEWELRLPDMADLFALILIKSWWRTLGRNPVETAIEQLLSNAIWLPDRI